MFERKAETGSLITGGIAAVFASACCAGPLILFSVGIGGAWISYLTVFEPYRWIFVGIGAAALIFAWRAIHRPVTECAPGEACAVPPTRRAYKAGFWIVTAFVAVSAVFPYVAPYFL